MISNIDLIQKYKKLTESGYLPKFKFESSIILTIGAWMLLIPTVFSMIKYFNNFLEFLICFIFAIIFPVIFGVLCEIYFDNKKIIQFKLRHKVYKGLLSDIFDLEDQETKDEFKLEKEMLERELFVKNGIPCIYILKMIDNIQLEKDNKKMEHEKLALYKNSQEEKEALIKAGTKIGAVFEEIKEATK